MSKGKRYTEELNVGILKEIENGASIASVSRLHVVNVQTLYRWRERYRGMSSPSPRLLRHVVSELGLDLAATREIAKGKW